jgi:glucan phosphoethanolaminetransferase (alkaline phosphatase superfamily)
MQDEAGNLPRVIRFTLNVLLILSWALWLGGLVGVLLSVTSIFGALDPDRRSAGVIAAQVFHKWQAVMIVAAAIALISSAGLSMMRKSVVGAASLLVLLLAATVAGAEVWVITPRIDRMREAGETQTVEFKQAHGMSMGLYSAMAGLLLVQGLLVPGLLGRRNEEVK